MEKLKKVYSYLSSLNYSHILVLLLIVKSIIYDVSYSSFLLTIPVLSYEAYKLFLASKRPDPIRLNAEITKELDAVKAKLNALTMDRGVKPAANQRLF